METYGIWSLLPVAAVIVLVLLTRRTAVSLLAGTLVGAGMLYGTSCLPRWLDVVYGVMGSDLWIWLVLVCGFFGSLVALFEASGGIAGFTAIAARFCREEKRTLLGAWLLGVVVFVDDWLSILSVGTAMRQSADRFRVPREMLAFISNATASSICVLIPTSTWGVVMVSQLVSVGLCPAEAGLMTFVKTLPFMFYPLAALVCGLLYALGVLPVFGPMKNAYRQAREQRAEQREKSEEVPARKAWNFLAPVLFLTAVTIATGEILYGTLTCLVFCGVLYLLGGMKPERYLDAILSGFKDMIGVLFIVTSAFILRDINSLLGMREFVIGAAERVLAPELLPLTAFLLVTALGVAAGNFWGICAISFPVIMPIAQALGGNLLLTAGAIVSATAAGSHVCFFGSEATLACAASQIENPRYAQTALPLLAVPMAVSGVLYFCAGLFLK